MIESSEQALAYLEAVVAGEIAPENPECREAALVVTRELRQARQTLADHAEASGMAMSGVREMLDGCRCQSCGEVYREDVMLPDEVWNEIRPAGKPPGGGLLCGRCIGLLMLGRVLRAQDDFAKIQRACTAADANMTAAVHERDESRAREARLREENADLRNCLIGVDVSSGVPDYVRRNIRAALASGESRAAEKHETAWLIESTFIGAQPVWWGYVEGMEEQWTPDPLRAIRFARREDAERAVHLLGGHMMKATEHVWVALASGESRDDPPKPWVPAHVFRWGAPVRPHDFVHDGRGDPKSGLCQEYVQAGPMVAICCRPFDAHRCVDHGCGLQFSVHPAPRASGESREPKPQCSSCGGTRLQSSGHGYRPCHCSPYSLDRPASAGPAEEVKP